MFLGGFFWVGSYLGSGGRGSSSDIFFGYLYLVRKGILVCFEGVD